MQVDEMVSAVQTLNSEDAFHARLNVGQWRLVAAYLTRYEIPSGGSLIRQNDNDRVLYFIESGSFQVFVNEREGVRGRIAILRPGSVVGEPSLFVDRPRMANVEAMMPSAVWALPAARFEELSVRQPELALEVLRGAGAVMAVRMRMNLERGIPMS